MENESSTVKFYRLTRRKTYVGRRGAFLSLIAIPPVFLHLHDDHARGAITHRNVGVDDSLMHNLCQPHKNITLKQEERTSYTTANMVRGKFQVPMFEVNVLM